MHMAHLTSLFWKTLNQRKGVEATSRHWNPQSKHRLVYLINSAAPKAAFISGTPHLFLLSRRKPQLAATPCRVQHPAARRQPAAPLPLPAPAPLSPARPGPRTLPPTPPALGRRHPPAHSNRSRSPVAPPAAPGGSRGGPQASPPQPWRSRRARRTQEDRAAGPGRGTPPPVVGTGTGPSRAAASPFPFASPSSPAAGLPAGGASGAGGAGRGAEGSPGAAPALGRRRGEGRGRAGCGVEAVARERQGTAGGTRFRERAGPWGRGGERLPAGSARRGRGLGCLRWGSVVLAAGGPQLAVSCCAAFLLVNSGPSGDTASAFPAVLA